MQQGYETIHIYDGDNWGEPLSKSSSMGNQRKWHNAVDRLYLKEQFFNGGDYTNDWMVEVIASKLGEIVCPGFVVQQTPALILDHVRGTTRLGVLSRDFLSNGEEFITLGKVIQRMGVKMPNIRNNRDTYRFMCDVAHRAFGIDISSYLLYLFAMDYYVGNIDRHFNNIGFIYNYYTNQVRPAPMFDFGLGLFEQSPRYRNMDFNTAVRDIRCKPYLNDHMTVMGEFIFNGIGIDIFKNVVDNVTLDNLMNIEFPSELSVTWIRYVDTLLRRLLCSI